MSNENEPKRTVPLGRAIRTFAEAMLAYIGTGALVLGDVNWVAALSAGGLRLRHSRSARVDRPAGGVTGIKLKRGLLSFFGQVWYSADSEKSRFDAV